MVKKTEEPKATIKEVVKEKAIQPKKDEALYHRMDLLKDTIDEMQKNLDFVNDKVKRILDRMGLE
mgnify:CR=1 FL=1|tara:strand:- start:604 stop:798 length:195 start_codon:yes stop_codon:yes gene_type:complete